jgi:hypothetical protein
MLSLLGCGPQVRPEVDGLKASVPSVRVVGCGREAVYRLEWTGEEPSWLLFRRHLPLHVRYYSYFGVPCGGEGQLVPLSEGFYYGKTPAQEVTLDLAVPFWARSMTLRVGRSPLIVERELSD